MGEGEGEGWETHHVGFSGIEFFIGPSWGLGEDRIGWGGRVESV